MRVDQIHGLLDAPLLEQVDQLRMVVEQAAIVEMIEIKRAQQHRPAHQLRVNVLHHPVAAGTDQESVEVRTQRIRQGMIAGIHGLAGLLDLQAQRRPVARTHALGKLRGDALLDQRQRVVDLVGFLHAGLGDEGAAVAHDGDEPVIGQPDQRLAHHDAADLEDLPQLALAELGAGNQPMVEDRLRQNFGDRLRSVAHRRMPKAGVQMQTRAACTIGMPSKLRIKPADCQLERP